jgi:CheY-like chemotaxis protein
MDPKNNTNKLLLIIEDDNLLAQALETKCTQVGYTIEKAQDGSEGLKTALEKHPNLILLDVLMPKMDGLTMLDKLRQDPWGRNVHVIIMSNLDATNEILSKVADDQPSYYLLKANTTLDQIIEKIQEVLKGDKEGKNAN